jgi:3-oxoacyl-(acyl-carrier-protein) synthase
VNALVSGQAIVSAAYAVRGTPDPTPFLRQRKLRKYMGVQDDLAVVAAAGALRASGLDAPLGERCGLYLVVGYIPFEKRDIDGMLAVSLEDGRFSMPRFARRVFDAVNPLMTFRVLPNMPAFHVSLNLDIQGPYAVSYPGVGQFYAVLEQAAAALESGAVDIALVGGVADQENFLVGRHFSRLEPPIDPSRAVNAAAFLVLETSGHARARGAPPYARLVECRVQYAPGDPFAPASHAESFSGDGVSPLDGVFAGPSSLALALAAARGTVTHDVATRDGFVARSTWEVACGTA